MCVPRVLCAVRCVGRRSRGASANRRVTDGALSSTCNKCFGCACPLCFQPRPLSALLSRSRHTRLSARCLEIPLRTDRSLSSLLGYCERPLAKDRVSLCSGKIDVPSLISRILSLAQSSARARSSRCAQFPLLHCALYCKHSTPQRASFPTCPSTGHAVNRCRSHVAARCRPLKAAISCVAIIHVLPRCRRVCIQSAVLTSVKVLVPLSSSPEFLSLVALLQQGLPDQFWSCHCGSARREYHLLERTRCWTRRCSAVSSAGSTPEFLTRLNTPIDGHGPPSRTVAGPRLVALVAQAHGPRHKGHAVERECSLSRLARPLRFVLSCGVPLPQQSLSTTLPRGSGIGGLRPIRTGLTAHATRSPAVSSQVAVCLGIVLPLESPMFFWDLLRLLSLRAGDVSTRFHGRWSGPDGLEKRYRFP